MTSSSRPAARSTSPVTYRRHTRFRQASTHRAAADRPVPHPDRAASMELGLGAAGRAAHRGGHSLDREPPLLVHDLSGGDLEPVQVEQDRP